jgi:predicted porin
MTLSKVSATFLPILATLCLSTAAHAAEKKDGDDSLTFHGITLSGVVDVGVAYQSHGAGLNSDYHSGLEWIISKNSSGSVTTVAPNGLSQTKLVLSGAEPLGGGWTGIFRLESHFSPISGALANSSKALVENAGVPLDRQTTNSDGNREGQLFAGSAYAGVSSKTYGALTFGRQTSTLSDAVLAYDPQMGSYAFSVLGYSGFLAGGGGTQNIRMDNTLKYKIAHKPFRAAALYQFSDTDGYGRGAEQVSLGVDHGPLAVDVAYSHVGNAVAVSGLPAAQLANPVIPRDSLAATVSDNTAYGIFAKYAFSPVTVFGGYEHIIYANPSHPLTNGFRDDGGYLVTALLTNNNAYAYKRRVNLVWTGFRYPATAKFTVSGGYYHIKQNSYHGDGCSSAAFGSCSGHEDVVSLVLDYRFTKHWDVYFGSMYSGVAGGMSSGFLHDSTLGTMTGARFTF